MKNNKTSIALIISTYNWVEALELSLLSVIGQTIIPDEVIIADDGSGEETANLILKMKRIFPCPLIHVWHEDNGFRLAAIRNKAIVAARSEYILQIDGDVILERHFIEDHLALAGDKCFVTGSRLNTKPDLCSQILQQKRLNISPFERGITNRLNGVRCNYLMYFCRLRYKRKNTYYVKGCNMAFWRKDLVAVNGYNEDMTGWGKEDSEIAARLISLGIKKQFIKFGGVVCHLYHKTNSQEREAINTSIFEIAISNKTTYCENGLDKYIVSII